MSVRYFMLNMDILIGNRVFPVGIFVRHFACIGEFH